MKTTETQKTFDVKGAEVRIEAIRSQNEKLNAECDNIIKTGIQKLIQIILRNVSLNKNSEVALIVRETTFEIKYIYDLKDRSNRTIRLQFAQYSDVMTFNDELKSVPRDKNIGIDDVYDIDFDSIRINYLRNGSIDDLDCLILYGYIANELKNKGEFMTTLEIMYKQLRVLWGTMNEGWDEARKLHEDKQKYFVAMYKAEFLEQLKENTVILIKNHKKEFVPFTAIKVHRLQKTTGYFTHEYGETKKIYNTDKKQLYSMSINTNHDWNEKRYTIEEIINDLAICKDKGDKVEIISWDDYLTMKSQISEERESISQGNQPDLEEKYLRINYLNN